jgi:hypothetical protein
MPSASVELTYCTNVHPAESLGEVRDSLARFVVPVREAFSPDRPFGVGLRLSDQAARPLAGDAEERGRLRDWMGERDLRAFTVNGFVHGGFQVDGLKERVYEPTWTDDERVAYTLRVAEALAGLLPEDVAGSVSTLAGTFRPRAHGEEASAACATRYLEAAEGLRALRDRTGRTVRLALEPEPWTTLECADDAVGFWERHLRPAATGVGMSPEETGEWLGLCYDTCHHAVAFDEPEASVARLADAGVPIHKVQVSSALEVREPGANPAAVEQLRAFDEPRFLHQTTGRRGDGSLLRALDLPTVFSGPGGAPAEGWLDCDAWRTHFHIPIFLGELAPLATTRPDLVRTLEAVLAAGACDHLEVETYTWDVTPRAARERAAEGDLVTSLVRELTWAEAELARLGVHRR